MNIGIKSIVVLTAICLCVSLLLAGVNSMTAPVIEAYEAKQAALACSEAMPDGTDFETVELPDGIPSTVSAIYKESGGGYVFKMVTTGFSSGYQIMCGISASGKITGTKVLAHSETPGYGSKTAESSYTDLYIGVDSSLEGDFIISGATKSSTAFKKAIADAFTAFSMIKGEG